MDKKQLRKSYIIRGIISLCIGVLCLIIILLNSNLKKIVFQMLAAGAIMSFVTGIVFMVIAFIISRTAKDGSQNTDKKPFAQGTTQSRYNAYIQSKPQYVCKDTTIRIPIDEEYTKAFLESVIYPAGFSKYMTDKEFHNTKIYIIKSRGMYGDYFKVYDVLELEKIKEVTLLLIDYTNDDGMQFKDILIFAGDESGHGNFFLDYGQNKSAPCVKFFDNEINMVEHVADSFDEFLANLVDEENSALKEIFKKEDEIINGATMTAQPKNSNSVQTDNGGFDDDKYSRLNAEAAAYNYDTNKRCFTFKDEKSDKFWCVNRIGEYYYVHYGKNGTFGRIEVKEAESGDVCKKFVDKTIAEKLGKGYVEIYGAVEDEFEKAKSGCRPALDSMYVMFHEDEPLIYIAAIKAACEQFCDIMRLAVGNKEKIVNAVKAVVLCLNQYAEDPGLIETEERDILGPWTDEVAALAGYGDPDDLAGEWREW